MSGGLREGRPQAVRSEEEEGTPVWGFLDGRWGQGSRPGKTDVEALGSASGR